MKIRKPGGGLLGTRLPMTGLVGTGFVGGGRQDVDQTKADASTFVDF